MKKLIGLTIVTTLSLGGFYTFKVYKDTKANAESIVYNLQAEQEVITFEEEYTTIFNRVEGVLSETTSIIFAEQEDLVQVKDSLNENEYMIVEGNYRYKYSIKLDNWVFSFDPSISKYKLNIPKDAISLDSVEQIGEIETIKHVKQGWEKFKDYIPFVENSDLELKDKVLSKLEGEKKLGKEVVYGEDEIGIYYEELVDDALNSLNKIKELMDPEGDKLVIEIK